MNNKRITKTEMRRRTEFVEKTAAFMKDEKKRGEFVHRFSLERLRIMSFALTVRQMQNQIKTVTRRHGSRNVKPGDLILAVEKARGVKISDRVPIAVLRVISVHREPLSHVTTDECVAEGFADKTPEQFIELYLKGNGFTSSAIGFHRAVNNDPFSIIETTRIHFKFEMML